MDAATNTVTAVIPVSNGPFIARVDPATNLVYVSNISGGTVTVIDPNSNTIVNTIPGFASSFGLDFVPSP
ncbi:YncE family protein [Mesobacillus zeae]|uniref:YncE family protein n=1 Tax=Mesobacillus zeae TaxID=1917180 RepID=UPI0039EF6E0A